MFIENALFYHNFTSDDHFCIAICGYTWNLIQRIMDSFIDRGDAHECLYAYKINRSQDRSFPAITIDSPSFRLYIIDKPEYMALYKRLLNVKR